MCNFKSWNGKMKLIGYLVPTLLLLSACGAGEGSLIAENDGPSSEQPIVTRQPVTSSDEPAVASPLDTPVVEDSVPVVDTPAKPEVNIIRVSSSNHDRDYAAELTLDGSTDFDSRWSAQPVNGIYPWIEYEFSAPTEVDEIKIHFLLSDERTTSFDIKVSRDGREWVSVWSGESSLNRDTGQDLGQVFSLANTGKISFLRIYGYGNSQPNSNWTSIREVSIPDVEVGFVQDAPQPPDPVVEETPPVDEGDNPIPEEEPIIGNFTVSTVEELNAALDQAVAGEVIVLKDGNYGELSIRGRLYDGAHVVLRAENLHGAEFSSITGRYTDSGYIHFDRIKSGSIDIDGHTDQGSPRFITVTNSWITGLVSFTETWGIVLNKNVIDVAGGYHGLFLNDVDDAIVTENFIARAQEDLMRVTGASDNVLVENNVFYDTMPQHIPTPTLPCNYNHSDGIQTFAHRPPRAEEAPSNLTIRGNLFYDDPSNNGIRPEECGGIRIPMQGIFVGDPRPGYGYENVLIDNNLLFVGSPNAISMNGAVANVVISNNTLIPWPGGEGASIRIRETGGIPNTDLRIFNNISSSISPAAEITNLSELEKGFSNNFVYARYDELSPIYYPLLFQGNGEGNRWQYFLPTPGSPIDFGANLGAISRLTELLDGEATIPAAIQN